MSEILPKGESVRQAVRWISQHLDEDPEQALPRLVDAATLRFDLTPRQAEGLMAFYRDARRRSDQGPS